MRKLIPVLCLQCLLWSCGAEPNEVLESAEPILFTWEGNHIARFNLGDSIFPEFYADTTHFGHFNLELTGSETVENIQGEFYPRTDLGYGYKDLQGYYNKLFGGEETDDEWSYWSFSNDDGIPRELYLFNHDSNRLEIKLYTASQF